MSQREISERTGIHHVNLSQFKRGTRDIHDLRLLGRLADILGLEIQAKRKPKK